MGEAKWTDTATQTEGCEYLVPNSLGFNPCIQPHLCQIRFTPVNGS